ncbi:MAG TPA: hypothetical protein HA330_02480 [Candidatus Thalassarchaeaceae archaeon]|nr:hypothetical protein [Candidatus Thalassarchaeaceae archaeon]
MMFANEWLGANNTTPIEQVLSKPWNGEGADGPFLSLNGSATWNMSIKEGEDVSIALSFNPRPFGDAVDNLDLVVSFGENERISSDLLEATEVVKIDAEDLVGVSSIQVSVVATAVGTAIPGWSGTVGNAGDRLGFALAASGVYRDNVTLNSMNDSEVIQNHTEEYLWGCILSSASNYNPNATHDDGSCYFDTTTPSSDYNYPGYSAPNGNYNDGASTLPPIGGGNILGDSWLSKLPEMEEMATICFVGGVGIALASMPFYFIKPKKKEDVQIEEKMEKLES